MNAMVLLVISNAAYFAGDQAYIHGHKRIGCILVAAALAGLVGTAVLIAGTAARCCGGPEPDGGACEA